MNVLLHSICRAGLNRGRIRDALTGVETYDGVTGHMVFDPNCKNISPLFLGTVHDGKITYQRITMDKPYAKSARMESNTRALQLQPRVPVTCRLPFSVLMRTNSRALPRRCNSSAN